MSLSSGASPRPGSAKFNAAGRSMMQQEIGSSSSSTSSSSKSSHSVASYVGPGPTPVPAVPSSTYSSSISSKSSYSSSSMKKTLSSSPPAAAATVSTHAAPHFERQPAPTINSTYVSPAASPFLLSHHQSFATHASAAVPTKPTGVKLPRDTPNAPQRNSGSTRVHHHPGTSPVAPASGDAEDLHAAERAMLEDVGYFRERKTATVTVESLLRDKREADRLAKARSKDMATINSILPTPPVEKAPSTAVLDSSLITALTQRLSTIEKIASKQAKSLGQKDVIITDLQSQIRSMEHSQDAALLYQLQNEVASNKVESDQLRRQVKEMELFLNDYGLVWVGFRAEKPPAAGAATDATTSDETTQASPSTSPHDLPIDLTVDRSDSPSASPNPATSPSAAISNQIYFDVHTFLASVAELNAIATEGNNLRIHTTPSGVTKFLPPPCLDLILYKDGMWFRGGPLRQWNMPEAREFIKDITEGYFPYELKETYPDGVSLAVVDRSKQYCLAAGAAAGVGGIVLDTTSNSTPKFQPFAGKGNRLEDGKVIESSPSPSPSLSPSASPPALSSAAPTPMPLSTFLAKLPEQQILKSGKIIDVRNEIKGMLGSDTGASISASPPVPSASPTSAAPSSVAPSASPRPSISGTSNATLVDTPALRLIQARESSTTPQSLAPLPPIATLQIKLDPTDGAAPLLLKLFASDTLGTVREYVDGARKDARKNAKDDTPPIAYELRTAYPPKHYPREDDARTLVEAGLTPNANMFIRNQRPLSGYRQRSQVKPKPDESWSTPAE